MPHAEVVFEPGSKSVVQYASEDELRNFLVEHHRRAVSGEQGGPSGHPAERVKKVLLYDQHPANYHADGRVDVDALKNLIDGMAKDNMVDGNQLIRAIRDEMSPVYPQDQGRHNSIYKMQENGELDLSFLNESGATE